MGNPHPGPGRKFPAGISANPGGRPKTKGFPEKIRALTNDGVELIDAALNILRDVESTRGERMKAVEWLADRMLGKAPQHLEVETTVAAPALSFDHLPLAERIELERLLTRALEGPVTVDADAAETTSETQH